MFKLEVCSCILTLHYKLMDICNGLFTDETNSSYSYKLRTNELDHKDSANTGLNDFSSFVAQCKNTRCDGDFRFIDISRRY